MTSDGRTAWQPVDTGPPATPPSVEDETPCRLVGLANVHYSDDGRIDAVLGFVGAVQNGQFDSPTEEWWRIEDKDADADILRESLIGQQVETAKMIGGAT